MTNLSGANLHNGVAVGPKGEGMDSPSRFPTYPAYKDSGVEWLGEVPNHWESRRLKFLFSLQKRPVVDGDGIVTCFRDGAVTLRSNRRTDGFTNAEKEIGYQGIRKGDLVIHAMDAFAGAIGVSDSDGKSSPVYSACTPNEGVSAYYYARLLRHMALAGFVSSLAKGIRERSTDFRWSDASEIYLPFPSILEQTQIARFLDHETARIDALIEEQQRLIELLKEKRQAVISHAVTKGLDQTAPMKDSGVEWLGEVPAHWQVKRLKHLVPSITVGIVVEPSKYYVDDGVPALRSLNVKPGAVVAENLVYLSEESNELHAKSKIFEGDIVAVRSGQPGTAAIVPLEFNGANCIDLIVIRKPLQGCSTFIFWYLNSDAALKQFSEGTSGAIQQHFNIAAASEMLFAWPPASEQLEINRHLDRACHQLDRLISVAGESKSLLLERRSALISTAVTGKIDVRDWQPPASTQAPKLEVAEAD